MLTVQSTLEKTNAVNVQDEHDHLFSSKTGILDLPAFSVMCGSSNTCFWPCRRGRGRWAVQAQQPTDDKHAQEIWNRNFLPWRRPSVRNLQQRARVMWDNGTFPPTWEAEQGSLSPLLFTAHWKGGSRHACCPLGWRDVPSVDFKRHTDRKTRNKNPLICRKHDHQCRKTEIIYKYLVEAYTSLAWLQHTWSVYNYQVYFMYYQRTTAMLNIAFILASKILTYTCNNRCSDVYS